MILEQFVYSQLHNYSVLWKLLGILLYEVVNFDKITTPHCKNIVLVGNNNSLVSSLYVTAINYQAFAMTAKCNTDGGYTKAISGRSFVNNDFRTWSLIGHYQLHWPLDKWFMPTLMTSKRVDKRTVILQPTGWWMGYNSTKSSHYWLFCSPFG